MLSENIQNFFFLRTVSPIKRTMPENVNVFVIIQMNAKNKEKRYGIQTHVHVNVLKSKNVQRVINLITIHAGWRYLRNH